MLHLSGMIWTKLIYPLAYTLHSYVVFFCDGRLTMVEYPVQEPESHWARSLDAWEEPVSHISPPAAV